MKFSVLLVAIAFATSAGASELVHNFKSPSFSGNGYSSHVLTIDQLERQREKENEDKAQIFISFKIT
jgi:hypothetical protein